MTLKVGDRFRTQFGETVEVTRLWSEPNHEHNTTGDFVGFRISSRTWRGYEEWSTYQTRGNWDIAVRRMTRIEEVAR